MDRVIQASKTYQGHRCTGLGSLLLLLIFIPSSPLTPYVATEQRLTIAFEICQQPVSPQSAYKIKSSNIHRLQWYQLPKLIPVSPQLYIVL